jgi:ribosomal protein L11 methyltransferase
MTSSSRDRSGTASASLETGEQSAHNIADLVAETFDASAAAASLVDNGNGRWSVTIHFSAAPSESAVRALVYAAAGQAAARALSFGRIAARAWVRESLAGLKPVAAGRFIVYGAHDRDRIAVNRIGIEIEAAFAFGTGHHGTTRGCLLALDRIAKSCRRPKRRAAPQILDLGTGTGVLAIAAARVLRRPVLATDIDPHAVRAARANVRLNRVGTLVGVMKADGIPGRRCGAPPFDLILANILLGPLQRLAAPLVKLTARGGRVVLSGVLTSQANALIAAYRPLALERRIGLDGWTTLVLARRTTPRRDVAGRRPTS